MSEYVEGKGSVRVRAYVNCHQGLRQYMEDFVRVVVDTSRADKNPVYYLAVFDGHGGPEAARLAQNYLFADLAKRIDDWSVVDDAAVVKAIKEAFNSTHEVMKQHVGSWPKAGCGLPSTSGTTASLVVIYRNKMYVANVGDSTVVMGHIGKCPTKKSQKAPANGHSRLYTPWSATVLTKDHKPDCPVERQRIEENGGRVMKKAGVHRVVWRRLRRLVTPELCQAVGNHGDTSASILRLESVPFLAVARSLGDLWSYNEEHDVYVVSPVPDVEVHELTLETHRCLVLASDGVWNVVSAADSVQAVQHCVQRYKRENIADQYHPAQRLVQLAIDRWENGCMRADNTSAIVALLLYDNEDETGLQERMCHPEVVHDYSSDETTHRSIVERIAKNPSSSPWLTFCSKSNNCKDMIPSCDVNDNSVSCVKDNSAHGVVSIVNGKHLQALENDNCSELSSKDLGSLLDHVPIGCDNHSGIVSKDDSNECTDISSTKSCSESISKDCNSEDAERVNNGSDCIGVTASMSMSIAHDFMSDHNGNTRNFLPQPSEEFKETEYCDALYELKKDCNQEPKSEANHSVLVGSPSATDPLCNSLQNSEDPKLAALGADNYSFKVAMKVVSSVPQDIPHVNTTPENVPSLGISTGTTLTSSVNDGKVGYDSGMKCDTLSSIADDKHISVVSNSTVVTSVSIISGSNYNETNPLSNGTLMKSSSACTSYIVSSSASRSSKPTATITSESSDTTTFSSCSTESSGGGQLVANNSAEALSLCESGVSIKRKAEDSSPESSSSNCGRGSRLKKTSAAVAAAATGLVEKPANHLTRYHMQQIHVKQA